MYNAYAGFITSILSVQATGIKSITDLLFNNFKLGYSTADDTYIRVLSQYYYQYYYILPLFLLFIHYSFFFHINILLTIINFI